MISSHQQVRLILPQRYPILMVDQVLAYEDGHSIHAVKNISRNEPCFQNLVSETLYYPRTLALVSSASRGVFLL